jgi:hypothetical protein
MTRKDDRARAWRTLRRLVLNRDDRTCTQPACTSPVVCPECLHDIRVAQSCDQTLTYPYGQEPDMPPDPAPECRDCGTPLGGWHHCYCCVAACLLCDHGPQLLTCPHSPDLEEVEP